MNGRGLPGLHTCGGGHCPVCGLTGRPTGTSLRAYEEAAGTARLAIHMNQGPALVCGGTFHPGWRQHGVSEAHRGFWLPSLIFQL